MILSASDLEAFYSEFGESVRVTPVGSTTATALTGRVRRHPAEIRRIDGRVAEILHKASVLVFSSVNATYGGLVAPQPGDNWGLTIVQGGTLIDGWKAGAPAGRMAQWDIPVTYLERLEVGNK